MGGSCLLIGAIAFLFSFLVFFFNHFFLDGVRIVYGIHKLELVEVDGVLLALDRVLMV